MSELDLYMSFLGGSVVKNPPANAGYAGPIPGLGRYPAEGNGNPLQRRGPQGASHEVPGKLSLHALPLATRIET